ncbi:hypothetical protein ACFLRF_00195 [Candidatus Altiarchaeota archaeon]
MNRKLILIGLILCYASINASATNIIQSTVCGVLLDITNTMIAVGPTMVLLMFTYGGVKYTYGGSDPGARKSGKMICIHSIIGGILLVLAVNVLAIFPGLGAGC